MLKETNDTVFQLSLTELAFVLVFIVLLLIGSKFLLVDKEKASCEAEKSRCYAQLPIALANPRAAIDSLVNEPKLKEENQQLKKALADRDQQLKALETLRSRTPDPVREAAALDFLKGYEEAAQNKVDPDHAAAEGKNVAGVQKELDNCRGQLKHCVTVT